MATHEPELTEPVDLCTPDGRRLNPAAKGWSRRPLHRANLAGRWGRTKRWDYWCVQSDDLILTLTFADVDYLGLVAVEWIEPHTGRTGRGFDGRPGARGIHLPEVAGQGHLEHRSRRIDATIDYRDDATVLTAHWTDPKRGDGHFDIRVAQPPGHESLNVVIPWDEQRFQFTSKHQARPATGTVTIDGEERTIGGAGDPAWGIFDAGRGRWPYHTVWNWGGAAGDSADGRRVGVQIGAKWTAGTGFTENGVIVDGRLEKIGEELDWSYDWDRPMEPWRVRDSSGALDIELVPDHDRHSRLALGFAHNEVHQVFGRWTGSVPDGDGGTLRVEAILGFAEESRSKW